jgi:hypothetical protein
MGRVWVKELTGGLDTRRMPETTPGGVLIKGQDGHITSGGEFESRAAFVPSYSLPAGTKGLWYTSLGLLVFGSGVAPSMPTGVSYQRLQHADGVTALDRILSVDLYGKKVYAVAQFEDGTIYHFYDGVRVTDWFDGRARASFRVTGGTGTSTIDDILVNGVSIISAPVTWTGNNENTAALIAAAINSATTSPDYDATSVSDRVNIIAEDPGAAPNGFAVTFVLTNGFETTPPSGLVLAGGVDSTAYVPGTFVRTIKSKVYSVSDSRFHFSGIRQPTKWTTDATGAGFIDMAQESSKLEELTAVANYQGFVAIFAAQAVGIEYVDPDPDLNRITQILENTGSSYPKSITGYGDSDLFYLAESGCRSLKARDSSNAASTVDIGVPVDTLIRAKLASMTDAQKRNIVGLINQEDGRFWLILADTVYVFSYFANSKVSAWTTYQLEDWSSGNGAAFEIDDAVVFRKKVYIRSGDTIYAYGGVNGGQYDGVVAKAWLPFLAADEPTVFKSWSGLDAAVSGQWDFFAAMQPTDLSVREKIAVLTETTFNASRIPFEHQATHVSLHMESRGQGPHVISSAILHYLERESES